MTRKIPVPPKDELKNLYLSGNSISSLARHYSTSNPTVRSWLKEYDIDLKSHRQACSEVNSIRRRNIPSKEKLLELYKEGFSIKDLEKAFNVGQETIYLWLDYYGIERRTLSESCLLGKEKQFEYHRSIDVEQLEDLIQNLRLSRDEICDRLNISKSYLAILIEKFGLKEKFPNHFRSNVEKDLFTFCKSLRSDVTWESNDRKAINPYELDIYCPELGVAVEYCGLYWHGEQSSGKTKDYHQKKFQLCRESGIKLYTIFESDDIDKVKLFLKKKLTSVDKIFARNCELRKISASESRTFHEKYHLAGFSGGSVHIGLYLENSLVMSGIFGKSRFRKDEWECIRMTSSEIRVVGGVSKIFKYFIENYSPKRLVTFSDLRFGEGECYIHCGMTREKDTSPNYWYFNRNLELYSRMNFQKHKLKEKLEKFDSDLTEFQNMVNNGWDRIWDCGNAKYVLEK